MKLCFDHCYNFLLVDIKIEPSPIQNGRELLQLNNILNFLIMITPYFCSMVRDFIGYRYRIIYLFFGWWHNIFDYIFVIVVER